MTETVPPAVKRKEALTLPALVSLPQEVPPENMEDDGEAAGSYNPPRNRGRGQPKSPVKDGDAFDALVKAWLNDSCPGSFRSRNSREPYQQAFEAFRAVVDFDSVFRLADFILSLSRLGYKIGAIIFRHREIFLLVLPSSIDSALDSLASLERSADDPRL